MNINDIVQVRRFDGVDHWLYAVVQDPATNRVQIQHPGNAEDGKVLVLPAGDIRNRADLQTLIDKCSVIIAQANPQHGLNDAQIKQLAALDGFWASYLPPSDGNLNHHHMLNLAANKSSMHKKIVPHYQAMMKALSK